MELGLIENLQREDPEPHGGGRGIPEPHPGLRPDPGGGRPPGEQIPAPRWPTPCRLLSLPQEVQWLIEQGNLSAGHGRALLSLPAPEEQIQFAGEIMEKGYSVRRPRSESASGSRPDQPAQARPAPSPLRLYYKEAERQLTAGLGRRVTITQGKKKGKIALEYYDPGGPGRAHAGPLRPGHRKGAEKTMNPEEAPKTPPEETPPQSVESPPAHSPAPPDKPKSKSRPVKVYLTVLFCVALLLLLISFVMQQRNHLALQDLNDSISNTQEIADLQLENQRLQYELEDKQALEEQVQAQQKQVEALEWLRQIEAASPDLLHPGPGAGGGL